MNERIKAEDRVYKSKAGFFHVWRLANSFGIYNGSGVKVAEVACKGLSLGIAQESVKKREQRMAELCADALEAEFQW